MYWLVADTETVGLRPPRVEMAGDFPKASGVVQVAGAFIDPATLAVIEDIDCYDVDPRCEIAEEASKVHGKYAQDLVGCPVLEDVFFIEDPVVVIGHNVGFDMNFLAPYVTNLHGTVCTLALARHLVRGVQNHKLQTLAEHFQLDRGTAHDAGGDVFTTIELLKVLVNMSGKTLPQILEEQRQARIYHVMPFGKHKGMKMSEVPLAYVRWMLAQEIDADLRKSLDLQIKLRG